MRKTHGLRNSLLLTLPIAAIIITMYAMSRSAPAFNSIGSDIRIPVIDAGHGGPDGGAVSRTGDSESGINLDIALRIDLIFRLYGIPSLMTRMEDVSLHSPDAATLRQKKNSDLRNRVRIINSTLNTTLISIHQNSFPDSRYKGAQVFYSENPESKPLALVMQGFLRNSLDKENSRVPARSSAYLLENVDCPAVMIECGFLSNTQEAALLMEDHYRVKVAAGISAAYLYYSRQEEPAPNGE
jgi:N-acetylmuramoyl-L-alanine amidase